MQQGGGRGQEGQYPIDDGADYFHNILLENVVHAVSEPDTFQVKYDPNKPQDVIAPE